MPDSKSIASESLSSPSDSFVVPSLLDLDIFIVRSVSTSSSKPCYRRFELAYSEVNETPYIKHGIHTFVDTLIEVRRVRIYPKYESVISVT